MREQRTTLIESAGGDLHVLGDEVRDILSYGVEGGSEQTERIISRATNPYFLTKDAIPNPEDVGIFVNAIFQRYVEAADALGPKMDNQRNMMLAQVALAMDVLRGIDWDELYTQYHYLPAVRKEGAYIGWLSMVSESARMIRDDLGLQPPKHKTRDRAKTKKEIQEYLLNNEVIPGFEDLRSTIIDLVHDSDAPSMTRDRAAALLVTFGTDIPARDVNAEKLNEYKRQAMHWLARKLSYDIKLPPEGSNGTSETLRDGYGYLKRFVGQYPIGSNFTAVEWLASREDINATIQHIESHMAFALHNLLLEKQTQ